jgi:hypothetical protein
MRILVGERRGRDFDPGHGFGREAFAGVGHEDRFDALTALHGGDLGERNAQTSMA